MAWLWTSSSRNDQEEEEEEEYEDDDEEYSSEEDLSETGEDFAEEEEDDDPDGEDAAATDEDNDDDPLKKDATSEDMLSKESNGDYDENNDNDSYLREDEFAQLVGVGEAKTNTTNHHLRHPEATAETTTDLEATSQDCSPMDDDKEQQQQDDDVTTLEEKRSLLILAAEHDRVDILQAILSSSSTMDDTKNVLLHGATGQSPPPLHIAVAHGSVNAINCLLRMGADPSIRPQVPNHAQICGKTAWQVAFDTTPTTTTTIAPSKREGIRHAFTAEALRCIGADEVERLQQLLQAGLPKDCDVGGRSLAEWTLDLGAIQCQELVGAPPITASSAASSSSSTNMTLAATAASSCVHHEQGLPALENRLDELNNLSRALSQFLDNLAEEVSVCSGLLLVGSGAAALAAHVKTLKQQKVSLRQNVERHLQAWENSEDELAYWVRECGGVDILKILAAGGGGGGGGGGSRATDKQQHNHKQQQQQTSGSSTKEEPDAHGNTDESIKAQQLQQHQQQQQRLQTQIAACETKIRMLRASIADLSDENQRNLLQVERRGLQGGVRLVRSLREEIVELEFQWTEINSGDAACRAKIQLLQQYIKANPMMDKTNNGTKHQTSNGNTAVTTGTASPVSTQATGDTIANDDSMYDEPFDDDDNNNNNNKRGNYSTAMIVRPKGGNPGFLPFSIWRLLLRIMGLSNQQQQQQQQQQLSYSRPAMIV